MRQTKTMPRVFSLLLACCLALAGGCAMAQTAKPPADKTFKPVEGQQGKDVVWVPTPHALVETMLNVAEVTPRDFVIDLGSGDGRNVIAAARRGARALGVEFNPDMVEVSRQAAQAAGVADKAAFVQGDMFEADISQATVMALFLLPDNLRRLTAKFLDLKPGTRIVANTFGIDGWEADRSIRSEGDCGNWCSVLLYIVPAKVAGKWRLDEGELTLEQSFQMVHGALSANGANSAISNGRLRGEQIHFTIDGVDYVGRVNGDTIQGELKGSTASNWVARRVAP